MHNVDWGSEGESELLFQYPDRSFQYPDRNNTLGIHSLESYA